MQYICRIASASLLHNKPAEQHERIEKCETHLDMSEPTVYLSVRLFDKISLTVYQKRCGYYNGSFHQFIQLNSQQ